MTANDPTPVTPTDSNVADFSEAASRGDKKRYQLQYPVELGGQTITELWMRRPTLFDKVVAERQSSDSHSYEATANMLANICEVDPEAIFEMDEEYDLRQLVSLFNAFEEPAVTEGENTLILSYPIEVRGQRLERLTIRRPKARDSLEYKDEKDGERMARLCGYQLKELHDMDLKTDWVGLERIYASFRQRRLQRQSA